MPAWGDTLTEEIDAVVRYERERLGRPCPRVRDDHVGSSGELTAVLPSFRRHPLTTSCPHRRG